MVTEMYKFSKINIIKQAVVLLFIFIASYSYGNNYDSLWIKANDAYSLGEWDRSLSLYGEIEEKGLSSAQLYYNMGNAYFKSNNKGKAILYYERALKINPSYNDAENNLKIVSLQVLDKIENVPEFVVSTWIRNIRNAIDSNGWAYTGLALVAVLTLLLLIYKFSGRIGVRKISFIFSCITLFLVIIVFIFSVTLRMNANAKDSGIVLSSVSNVKSAPNATGSNLFILHEGTKVNILEDVGPWMKIELADGRQGWIDSSSLEII